MPAIKEMKDEQKAAVAAGKNEVSSLKQQISTVGQRAKGSTAQVSKLIILAFSFDNDFIDPLVQELKQRCPNGVISGILTKDETISYVLAHTRRVTATGYCQSAVGLLDKESHSVASDEGTTL